jgi:hypothetical protein
MNFSKSQKQALIKIEEFLNSPNKLFTLKGSAGTGKSTVITSILLKDEYKDKKIAFCATTNKAVSILKEMSQIKDTREVVFLTIHKLLNIKRTIDRDGKELFNTNIEKEENKLMKTKAKSIYNYDIVVIDESSMVTKEIIHKLIKISNKIKGKIIFVGDSAQLPPVNEKYSLVFRTDDIPSFELDEIMRYKGNIVELCNKVRELVNDNSVSFSLKTYVDNDIKKFKNFEKWVGNYIKIFKSKGINEIPIFIVYTNAQCDKINKAIREILFLKRNMFDLESYGNKKLDKYVSGEIILFNGYYKSSNGCKYYTSQKEKVLLVEEDIYRIINFNQKIDENLGKLTIEEDVKMIILKYLEKIYELIDNLSINIYKLHLNSKDIVYVIKNINDYNVIIENSREILIKLKRFMEKRNKENISFMNFLWEHFYEKLIDKFADISYGYCITTHKSQGSTFSNVYVDMNNIIFKNKNQQESFRCLYTAITRTSKKLNILV